MFVKAVNGNMICTLEDSTSLSVEGLTAFKVVGAGAKSNVAIGNIVFSSFDKANGLVIEDKPMFLIKAEDVFLVYGQQ